MKCYNERMRSDPIGRHNETNRQNESLSDLSRQLEQLNN